MTTYKETGVDIEAADKALEKIKSNVKKTFNKNVLTNLGSFGACYKFPKDEYDSPVLVSSADGVGTKLKLAFISNNHKTIGQCLINHCVNDILVMGAKPLFFLDYFGTGKLDSQIFEDVISGLSKACQENNCALIGGETAEMPGFYDDNEYDLCGTIIGAVDQKNLLSSRKVSKGDILIGLPSTGLHTNGYSLARAVLLDRYSIDEHIPEINSTLLEALLAIHKSYLNIVYPILREDWLVSISHITGGGILGNTKRVLEKEQDIEIDWSSWQWPPIFKLIQKVGNVPQDDMINSFNLGIGLVLVIKSQHIEHIKTYLNKLNEPFKIIGKVV